jgi:hypothetical protein
VSIVKGWENVKVCPGCRGAGCKSCYGGVIEQKAPKYGNKKTEVNGIKFDSIVESEYYIYLLTLQKAGIVKDFKLQPKFILIPGVTYIADFHVEYSDGRELVIDVKSAGTETKEFKIKRKLYEHFRGVSKWPELSVITRDKNLGWIELDELKKTRGGGRK